MVTWYQNFCRFIAAVGPWATPYCRRFFRFLALPYCYFYLINWEKCDAGRWKVAKDFAYIFFVLKYYPEYYFRCQLWKVPREKLAYYYGSIYDAYQKRAFEQSYSRPEYSILYSDKDICSKLCRSLGLPHVETIHYLKPNDDFQTLISKALNESRNRKLLLKPVRGSGGKRIKVVTIKKGNAQIRDGTGTYAIDTLELDREYLLQPFVEQHEDTARLNPSSVNTVRVITLMTSDNEVRVILANVKIGIRGSYVDNASSGGILAGVCIDTGMLFGPAIDFDGNVFHRVPDTGIQLDKYQLPLWEDVVQLARESQRLFHYSKIMGLDIAITKEGPLIIEINHKPDLGSEERIHGPLLGIQDVWSIFNSHNLLINRPSRKLYS